jgi:hypothetical protein
MLGPLQSRRAAEQDAVSAVVIYETDGEILPSPDLRSSSAVGTLQSSKLLRLRYVGSISMGPSSQRWKEKGKAAPAHVATLPSPLEICLCSDFDQTGRRVLLSDQPVHVTGFSPVVSNKIPAVICKSVKEQSL